MSIFDELKHHIILISSSLLCMSFGIFFIAKPNIIKPKAEPVESTTGPNKNNDNKLLNFQLIISISLLVIGIILLAILGKNIYHNSRIVPE